MAKTTFKKKIINGQEYYFYRLRHKNLNSPKDLYAKTVKELKEKIKETNFNLDNNIVENKNTFQKFFENWLFDIHFNNLKPSSKENYESIYRKHIKNSSIGDIKIKNLSLIDVQRYYNKLISNGCSASRVRNIHRLIQPCIRFAYDNNFIIKDFTRALILPKDSEAEKLSKKNKVIPLTLEEQRTFVSAIKGNYFEMLFLTALNTGLRQGELFALTWKDINFDKAYIDVNKTFRAISNVTREGREPSVNVVQTPKTPKSIRQVPIPAFLIPLLKQHKRKQRLDKLKLANMYEDNNLVFCTKHGKYLNDATVRFHYKNILERCNISERKFHDLRHTYATRLFELGEEARAVQELLGHSNVSVTLNTYTHVLDNIKERAVSKLNDLYITMG